MNQNTAHWLRLMTVGVSLLGAPLALGQDGATAPASTLTATELYELGAELYQKGQLLEAKDVLLSVDLAQLSRAQRSDVHTLVNRIDTELQQMPVERLRLLKAQYAFRQQDFRSAESHLRALVASDAATDDQKAEARNLLAEIDRAQQEIAGRAPMMLESAVSDFEAGRYRQAEDKFQTIYNSGVDLEPERESRLHAYLQKIYELRAVRGEEIEGRSPEELGVTRESIEQLQAQARQDTQTDQPTAQPGVAEITTRVEPQFEQAPTVDEDLIRQARQAEVMALIAEAQQAEEEGRYSDALRAYERVLAVQPDNEAAVVGRDRVRTLMTVPGLLERQIGQDQLLAQQLRAEVTNLMEQANIRMAEGDFALADELVARARFQLEQGQNLLSASEYEQLRERNLALAEQINEQRRVAEAQAAREQELEVLKTRLEEQRRIENERQRQITERLITVRRLQEAQRYEEALQELEALLFMSPGHPAAEALQATIREILLYQRFEKIQKDNRLRLAEHAIESVEAMRVPRDVMEYPEDWEQITLRRTGQQLAFLDTEADRQVWNALASRHVPVEFANHRLEDVVAFIAEAADINVDVDWKALDSQFITRDTPINLKLNDRVSLRVVLDRVLGQLGSDEYDRPQYSISDGILTISTRERLQQNPVTHVYDISDLLINIPDFDDAPTFDLDSVLAKNNRQGFGGSLFPEGEDADANADTKRQSRDQMIRQIKDIITSTIDPRTWEVNGGDVGVVQELNGNLIITTTARNHQSITNLLGKLREVRAIMISVDTRFLLVSEDFFEQIGFDLDIFYGGDPYDDAAEEDPNLIPSDLFRDPLTGRALAGPQRQFFSLYELQPAVDPTTGLPVLDAQRRQLVDQLIPESGFFQSGAENWSPFSPWAVQQNSLNMAETLFNADATSFAGQALVMDPALSYSITYLDDIQVDLFIQATQADRRSVQLTAPKLTFFNGQRSFVQVTTSQFFVSDLQPITGEASAGFDPELSTLREGVVLDVEGTASDDRRYVTMTVLASLADVLDIQQTPIPILVGGDVIQSDDDVNVLANSAFLERPILQISRVNTTVNVPDRGTIMLGGQSIRNDIEVETGVPVLSKIPWVNRFFTNRLMTTEERTLLILVKPTVVIQQEEEERLFPGLTDSISGGGVYSGAPSGF